MIEERIIARKYMSPCGELLLASWRGKVCLCDWTESRRYQANLRRIVHYTGARIVEDINEILDTASCQLDEYFVGRRQVFDIPILHVGTEFQMRVWRQLPAIPFGTTVAYSDISRLIGAPDAVRAVASAVGSNALSIIVPCHRVVGRNGALTGYAGGLAAKRFLLDHELS